MKQRILDYLREREIRRLSRAMLEAIQAGDAAKARRFDEARRAMTFRDDYVLPANSREAMHMLGNAVPPLAAREVIAALGAAA